MREIFANLFVIFCVSVALAACSPPPRRGGGAGAGGAGGGQAGGQPDGDQGGEGVAQADGEGGGQQNGEGGGAGEGEGEGEGADEEPPNEGGEEGAGGDEGGEGTEGEGEGHEVEPGDCAQILRCARDCDGVNDCITECRDPGTIEAQAAFAALNACATVEECGLHNTDCLARQCGNFAEDCGIDPVDPEGGEGHEGLAEGDEGDEGNNEGGEDDVTTCREGLECAQACGQDAACGQACFTDLEGAARNQISNLLACQQFVCGNDPDCVQANCADEFAECTANRVGTRLTCGGVFSCASLYCADAAGNMNQACAGACQQAIDPAEMPALQAVAQCQNENNCRDQACLEENCLDQFEECFGIENDNMDM